MSGFTTSYRKRKASVSLESDRKRSDRYDYGSYKPNIKQEFNSHAINGGQEHAVTAYNFIKPVAPVGVIKLQSAVVYKPERFSNQYVEAYMYADEGNVIPSTRNCGTRYDAAIAIYDDQRQSNFQHKVYINSLRQIEPRNVNFTDLKRHLLDIDIGSLSSTNFSNALDLSEELESSLKYFVDTRNEIVFLRKLERQQCVTFLYNEINISNRKGLLNRLNFLENESYYRCNRMNQLFRQLQAVVPPSIVDDIRYMHSIAYDKCWANRARYWFSQFKEIRWGYSSRYGKIYSKKYRTPKHEKYQNWKAEGVKDEIFEMDNWNIKNEKSVAPKVFLPKNVEHEILSKAQDTRVQSSTHNNTMPNIVEKRPDNCNNKSEKGNTGNVEMGTVEMSAMQTSAVEMSALQTSAVEMSAMETSAVEMSAVKTTVVETTAVETSAVQTSVVQTSAEAPPHALNEAKEIAGTAQSSTEVIIARHEENENENVLSNSLVIVEEQVSVITVADEDLNHSNIHPEVDIKN